MDALVAALALTLIGYVHKRVSKATFLARYSLRARLSAGLLLLACLCLIGLFVKADMTVLLGAAFVGFALLVHWILRDVTKVGITNAFETTRQGVSAEASLKEVRR